MSLAQNIIAIVSEEMKKHNASRLVEVQLRCGALANVVPEALTLAFEVLIEGTPLLGARLLVNSEPLVLGCGGCGQEFSPLSINPSVLLTECPQCGEEIGHKVLSGKELYIDNIVF